MVITSLAIIARLGTRWAMSKTFGIDDFLILVAMVGVLPMSSQGFTPVLKPSQLFVIAQSICTSLAVSHDYGKAISASDQTYEQSKVRYPRSYDRLRSKLTYKVCVRLYNILLPQPELQHAIGHNARQEHLTSAAAQTTGHRFAGCDHSMDYRHLLRTDFSVSATKDLGLCKRGVLRPSRISDFRRDV